MGMRFVAILATLAVIGWLAAHQLAGAPAPPAPQQVVNDARQQLGNASMDVQKNADSQNINQP